MQFRFEIMDIPTQAEAMTLAGVLGAETYYTPALLVVGFTDSDTEENALDALSREAEQCCTDYTVRIYS